MNDLIKATLVFDGGTSINLPPECGTPRMDQLIGTVGENLCELAGRVCYDSLGGEKARNTPDYHKHILQVGHGSVYEHYPITFTVVPDVPMIMPTALSLMNRPGVFSRFLGPNAGWRITANLRSILEWDRWSAEWLPRGQPLLQDTAGFLGEEMARIANRLAPNVVAKPPGEPLIEVMQVTPANDDERWISFYLAGSRGFSHEQVRHGDFTAISQRSTRFVDECDSPWVRHPLLTAFIESGADEPPRAPNGEQVELSLNQKVGHVESTARRVYREVVEKLQPWLKAKGADATTSRKQARGAARGYLGNALATEMIFSASVGQWKRMLAQRANPAADAEIREVFCKVLVGLQASRYSDAFAKYKLVDSVDGIGQVVIDTSTFQRPA